MTRHDRSEAFGEKYLSLAPMLAGEFHDSSTIDDEANARDLRLDYAVEDRIALISGLLADAHRLMTDIEEDWEIMAEYANRRIRSASQAREWLMRVMVAWQEELTRLQRGDPGSRGPARGP